MNDSVYVIDKHLGSGTFGDAFAARSFRSESQLFQSAESQRFSRFVLKTATLAFDRDLNDNELVLDYRGSGSITKDVGRSREAIVARHLGFKMDHLAAICLESQLQDDEMREEMEHKDISTPPSSNRIPVPLIPAFVDYFYVYGAMSGKDRTNEINTQSGSVDLVLVSQVWGQDLFTWVKSHTGLFRNAGFSRCITRQIFHLLASLHARGFIHRDIKLVNILMNMSSDGYPHLRLCDMGSCRRYAPVTNPSEMVPNLTPFVTSRFYRAPELLLGSAVYDSGVDVWAAATTIYEMFALIASYTTSYYSSRLSYCRATGENDVADPQRPLRDQFPVVPSPHEPPPPRSLVNFFHGMSEGLQFMHILNLLGTPTREDIFSMGIPGWSAHWLSRISIFVSSCYTLQRMNRPDLVFRYVNRAADQSHLGFHRDDAVHRVIAGKFGARYAKYTDFYNTPHRNGVVTNAQLLFDPAFNRGNEGGSEKSKEYDDANYRGNGSRTLNQALGLDVPPTDSCDNSNPGNTSATEDEHEREVEKNRRARDAEILEFLRDPLPVPPMDMAAMMADVGVPEDISDLLVEMLTWNPTKRLSCAQALRHPSLTTHILVPTPQMKAVAQKERMKEGFSPRKANVKEKVNRAETGEVAKKGGQAESPVSTNRSPNEQLESPPIRTHRLGLPESAKMREFRKRTRDLAKSNEIAVLNHDGTNTINAAAGTDTSTAGSKGYAFHTQLEEWIRDRDAKRARLQVRLRAHRATMSRLEAERAVLHHTSEQLKRGQRQPESGSPERDQDRHSTAPTTVEKVGTKLSAQLNAMTVLPAVAPVEPEVNGQVFVASSGGVFLPQGAPVIKETVSRTAEQLNESTESTDTEPEGLVAGTVMNEVSFDIFGRKLINGKLLQIGKSKVEGKSVFEFDRESVSDISHCSSQDDERILDELGSICSTVKGSADSLQNLQNLLRQSAVLGAQSPYSTGGNELDETESIPLESSPHRDPLNTAICLQ